MGQKSMYRRGALLCGAMLAWHIPLQAQSLRMGIDVSAEAEATSNPYLDEEDSGWVGAGTVEIRPWLASITATDRVELEAFARGRAFTSGFDFEDSFGAALNANSRASERTSLFGQASIVSTSARSNFSRFNRPDFGFGFDPLTPTDPLLPVQPGDAPAGVAPLLPPVIVPPIDDITIVGLRGRSTNMSLSAGVNRQLDSVSSLNATIGYNRLWVEDDELSDYDSVTANLGYSRRVSTRTSVGAAITAGQSRFDDGIPKTTTLGASVNAQHQFSDRWTLSGSVGVSNSRADALGPYPEFNETGLVGTVAACRTDPQSRLCLGFSRSQQPSTLGQVRVNDAIDLSYSERISARDRVDLFGNYGRSSSPNDFNPAFADVEIASVGGTYTRSFSQRLEGYAFARASKSWGGFLSDEPSLSFGVGVRARIGDRR